MVISSVNHLRNERHIKLINTLEYPPRWAVGNTRRCNDVLNKVYTSTYDIHRDLPLPIPYIVTHLYL